jgi:hypothetical protein
MGAFPTPTQGSSASGGMTRPVPKKVSSFNSAQNEEASHTMSHPTEASEVTTSQNAKINSSQCNHRPENEFSINQLLLRLEGEIQAEMNEMDLNSYVTQELSSTFNLGLNYQTNAEENNMNNSNHPVTIMKRR